MAFAVIGLINQVIQSFLILDGCISLASLRALGGWAWTGRCLREGETGLLCGWETAEVLG